MIGKLFIAHKFHGEDPVFIKEFIGQLRTVLDEYGLSYYCHLWDENFPTNDNRDENRIYCLERIAECQIGLIVLHSAEESIGLNYELEEFKAKSIPIILIILDSLEHSEFINAARDIFEFHDFSEFTAVCESVVEHLLSSDMLRQTNSY